MSVQFALPLHLALVLLVDSTPHPFSFSLQTSLQKPFWQPPVSVPTTKAANTTRFLVCNLIIARCQNRQLSLLSHREERAKPCVHSKEAVAGLQTSGTPQMGCTLLLTAEYDCRPKKIHGTGYVRLPFALPSVGPACLPASL